MNREHLRFSHCALLLSLWSFGLAGNALALDCGFGREPNDPLDDVHLLTDTAQALAIWTVPDSATWLSFYPWCEELLPESYDMPEFADALWDSTEPLSATRFYLDNSNNHHLLTAVNPRSPSGGMWAITGDVSNGYWDLAYIRRALDIVDEDLDFSLYDYNRDGKVDQLFFYVYHISGTGTIGDAYWQSDDSVDTGTGRIPVSVRQTVIVQSTAGDFLLLYGLTTHEYGHTFDIWDLYGNGISSGLGGFCCEAANGFSNAGHTDARPALHNPLVRMGGYWWWRPAPGTPWLTAIPIASTQLDYHFLQYATDQALYRISPDPTRPSQ